MKKIQLLLWVFCLAGLLASPLSADSQARRKKGKIKNSKERVEFKDARMKFEINATDGDGGVQIFIDADEWRSLAVYDPRGKKILKTTTSGSITKQGGTELFLESAEPDFSELPLDDLLKRFPEGEYRFRGRGLDGERIVGTAILTHVIPDGPKLIAPLGVEGLDPSSVELSWMPVDSPDDSTIIAYEVIVAQAEADFPAVPKVALDIILPAHVTSLSVPDGFLLSSRGYEWEVLAIEESGNQTLSSSFFSTGP